MLYTLLILVTLAVGVMMLHLRLRLEYSDARRLLFVGLGRSGPEIDFVDRIVRIRLCGITLTSIAITGRQKPPTPAKKERVAGPRRSKMNIGGWIAVLPQTAGALRRYFVSLLRATVIEQAEGEIRGGFETPDLTGQVFGYYQAALAAVPSEAGRIRYTPDWTGESWSVALRFSASMPLYRLAWSTLVLLWHLPITKIVRLVRNNRKGVRND
jgi:hypothetical protein